MERSKAVFFGLKTTTTTTTTTTTKTLSFTCFVSCLFELNFTPVLDFWSQRIKSLESPIRFG